MALTVAWAVIAISGMARADDGSAFDLEGRPFDPFAEQDARAVVLLFASPDCPISNRLAPTVIALHRELAADARFYLVYPETEVTAAVARRHRADYGYPFPALLDPEHTLVSQAGATALAEAAVLSPRGERFYLGRVDNRFVSFGKTRPRATQHDLRNALEAVLAGRPVTVPRTDALGCIIPPPE